MNEEKLRKEIKNWISLFMITLFLSGLTAIPIEPELEFISRLFPLSSGIGEWLDKVYTAFQQTNKNYPFLAYGYDWLAFAHFILAVLFIGPRRDPVKNKWVIEFGMIACLLIIPFAIIAGHFRNIPLWWRLVDCSFGVIGLLPLALCLAKTKQLETTKTNN